MTNLILLVLFPVACVLAAAALSDALMQRLARAFRGAALEPRQLLTARKLCYVALIAYLFTGAYQWRAAVVNTSAATYAVREESRGDVHLTGALVRLSLGGFRGITTCYLWSDAIDKQAKNQLNELEVIVGWLTELQPHFNTPWLFQSWNLAYNVSNKTDQPADKYFWISRGTQLLADGERQNHDDPDLRFELAGTFQRKICQSDETNYHRSLFQLSLIPPNERDPARFRPRRGYREKVNLEEFAKFCEKHPQLIRRLREGIHKDSLYEQNRLFTCRTPAAVVQFLADNYRVPSLYPDAAPTPAGALWVEDPDRGLDPDVLARFPVLPPPRSYPPSSAVQLFRPYDDMDGDLTDESPRGENLDAWDAYLVARAWYSYAQEPLPAPSDLPGEPGPVVDRVHQRLNRRMETIIFRHYPARAQSYVAERLEEEGWFDGDGWSTKGPEWLTMVIGAGRNWAGDAWGEAHKMWQAHGERNHLLMTSQEAATLPALAASYRAARKLAPKGNLPQTEADDNLREGWQAARFLEAYDARRQVSNFLHNYTRALVEQDKRTVRVRKLFYDAEALALTGSTLRSLYKYQDPQPDPDDRDLNGLVAMDAWAKVLEDYDDFRHDELVQEQTYEIELTYLNLLNRALPGNELKAQLAAAATAGGGLNPAAWLEAVRPELFPPLTAANGPFDLRKDKDGTPWILEGARRAVLQRRRDYKPPKKDTDEAAAKPPDQPAAPPGHS